MKKLIVAATLALSASTSFAADLDSLDLLSAQEFEGLSKDLVAALSYKAGSPAESLGIIGFDVGVSISTTETEASDAWNAATGDDLSTLVIPKLYVQKGLPFDIDVGGYYVSVPSTNIEAWGGEIKYAFISGNIALPAVAVRAAHTALMGVDQLELTTNSVDVSVSKSFLFVTPYIGIGRVWGTSTPLNEAKTIGLEEVEISENRSFIGVSIAPALFNLALERDAVGGIASYNLKLGISF